MHSKGRSLDYKTVRKIYTLLATTEMSAAEIAKRMNCSTSTVGTLNRKRGIRIYNGKKFTGDKY